MGHQKKSYKKFVATAATATLVASAIVPVASASFTDVAENNEFATYINTAVEAGYVKGYADGTFGINDNLKRSQVVIIIGRYLESLGYTSEATTSPWSDVTDTEVIKYGNIVKDAGVFTGYANGTLNGAGLITRENMAVVLDRLAKTVTGTSLSDVAADIEDITVADLATANTAYQGSIQALRDLGISTADNFNPKGNLKRGQFAKFIVTAVEKIDAIAPAVTAEDIAKEIAAVDATLPVVADITADNAVAAKTAVEAAKTAITAIEAKIAKAELTEEEVAELNKAIEAVEAKYDAIVEAADKAIEAAKQLTVDKVEAINAKEIKVTFNKELTDAAAAQANYAVKVAGATATFTTELQDDKKSVIVRLDSAIAVNTTYELDIVKDIVATDLKVLKATNNIAYDGLPTLFNDTVAPTLVSVEATSATNVRVYFNEPVASFSLKLDNGTATTGTATTNTKGQYFADVTVQDAKTVGTHNVVLYDVTDLADNKVSIVNGSYTISNDTVAPAVQSVTAHGENTFKVKFSEEVAVTAANFEAYKGSAKLVVSTVVLDSEDKTNTTYIVTVAGEGVNPLYATKETTVNLTVKVKNYKDASNLLGAEVTNNVTLSQDKTAPIVAAEALNYTIAANNKLVVRFNEDITDLATADVAKITVVFNGIEYTNFVTAAALANDENGKQRLLELTVDPAVIKAAATALAVGEYTVVLPEGFVADTTGNKVAKTTTKVTHTDSTDVVQFAGSVTATTANTIAVDFGTEMGESATALSNYTLDGKALPAGTEIKFVGSKQVVHIVLPSETYAKTETQKFIISTNVKTGKGLAVVGNVDKKTAYEATVNLTDNVAPVLTKAEFVKESNDNDNTKAIKLTFSEAVTATDVADFLLLVGTTQVKVASVEVNNAKELVLKLAEGVNVTQASTLELTVDADYNTNEVIEVVDAAGNKAKAVKLSVGTVVNETLFNSYGK